MGWQLLPPKAWQASSNEVPNYLFRLISQIIRHDNGQHGEWEAHVLHHTSSYIQWMSRLISLSKAALSTLLLF